MNLFKRRHFKYEIIIWAVRWYCKYGISYRDLEEMLSERGVKVDHSTIYRWVQYYAPKILDRLKCYWKPKSGLNWRVDETYVKVKGKWVYLYRAVDQAGDTIHFYLSKTRNSNAAQRFLSKALKSIPKYSHPRSINTDKNPIAEVRMISANWQKFYNQHRPHGVLNNQAPLQYLTTQANLTAVTLLIRRLTIMVKTSIFNVFYLRGKLSQFLQ